MLERSVLNAAALLGRPEQSIDMDAARAYLGGRRVLITGAGGSVGSSLAAQVLQMRPAELVLLDHHDHSLYALHRRLSDADTRGVVRMALADTRNTTKMRQLIATARPEVVFHLAAYKHVPLGEQFPDEALAVNVLATQRLLELCDEQNVETFAYPSSDKAVNPPSLYGATKRLAETMVQRAGLALGRRFVVIRYVNIIGTRGSVIETLAGQLQAEERLTITDAAMTRYWMTMDEAVWLLASAVTLGQSGGVYMLDGLVEIPVLQMAGLLATQLGIELDAERVVFTGRRAGERLREELLSESERLVPGPATGIGQVTNALREQHLERVQTLMSELDDYLGREDLAALRDYVMAAAMALQ